MSGSWRKLSLRDAGVQLIDCDHRTPPAAAKGYPYVAIPQLRNGRIDATEARRITAEHFIEWTRKAKPAANDVVLSRRCNPGETAHVSGEIEFALGQNLVLLRSNGTTVHPNFLRWLVRGPEWWQQIQTFLNVGAVFDSLKCADIPEFRLTIPPIEDQIAIAEILGSLDNKIDLNRRISETLQAMARTLFKSWFTDFDPVTAKAEGRTGGLLAHVEELFPDSMWDSELGRIPITWEVSNIGNICEVIDCMHSKKPERTSAGRPLLQLGNIRDDGLLDMQDIYWISETDYAEWISRIEASPGDCVVTNVGRVGAVAQVPTGLKAALGRNMTGVRCRDSFPFPTFLIECLLSGAMRDEMSLRTDAGTILDALNVRNIPKLRLVKPDARVAELFERTVRPFRARMEGALAESQVIGALRDTLLPKLISGKLHVKDAERSVAAVV